jgi:hypothetical protein
LLGKSERKHEYFESKFGRKKKTYPRSFEVIKEHMKAYEDYLPKRANETLAISRLFLCNKTARI